MALFALPLMSVLLTVVAQLLLKFSVSRVSSDAGTVQFAFGLLSSAWFWCGVLAFGVSLALWLYGLRYVPLSKAYPFVALGIVLVSLFSLLLFHEPVTPRHVVALLVVLFGLFLLVWG